MATTAVPPRRSRCRPNWSFAPQPDRHPTALRTGPARPPTTRSQVTSRREPMDPDTPLTRRVRTARGHGTGSRRRLLRLFAATALAMPLIAAGCGGDEGGSGDQKDPNRKIELQVFWW